MIQSIRSNFTQNKARVDSLVALFEVHPDAQGRGRAKARTLDILRASVVFLHAALEDVLRSIAEFRLPLASAEALNEIPFIGSGPNPKKVLLGELAPHRGKTIDALIHASVKEHLKQSNYNDTTQIAGLITQAGLPAPSFQKYFSSLQQMMERRHAIVHRADRKPVGGSGNHNITTIHQNTVKAWIKAVDDFVLKLLADLEALPN